MMMMMMMVMMMMVMMMMKGKCVESGCSASCTTHDHQRFTLSEVAADWHDA